MNIKNPKTRIEVEVSVVTTQKIGGTEDESTGVEEQSEKTEEEKTYSRKPGYVY